MAGSITGNFCALGTARSRGVHEAISRGRYRVGAHGAVAHLTGASAVRVLRWRAEKPGFQTAEVLSSSLHKGGLQDFFGGVTVNLSLTVSETVANEMVRVPGGDLYLQLPAINAVDVNIPDYWMDRYEVTNIQFKKF